MAVLRGRLAHAGYAPAVFVYRGRDALEANVARVIRGKPEAKTLAQCPLCHQRAHRGWFAAVTYTVSDERFRTDDVDMSASLPVDTKRTWSAQATAAQISSASSMPRALLAKNVKPRSIWSRTAASTSGWPWPRIIGPHEPT